MISKIPSGPFFQFGWLKMAETVRIYFVGTAGSGKSTLTQAFRLWMEEQGLSAITVNLDPGAESLGYTPDVDIRDWVSVRQVMEQQDLGPNGAQIVCADLAALSFPEISQVIEGFRSDYILIDTPGQIELFAFREASDVFLNAFTSGNSIIAFVLDPVIARTPAGLISLFVLSSSVQFRFDTPLELVLGKADLLSEKELEEVREWCREPELLQEALQQNGTDMRAIASMEFQKATESLGAHRTPIPISAFELTGIEDLYNTIQQLFFGGEDLSPD
jgi:GTPase SAR1 family protein